MGNVGPFETPEAAIKAAIHALYSQLGEQTAAAAAFSEELAALRAKLDQADGGDGLGHGGGPLMTWQMKPERIRHWIGVCASHSCPMLGRCATMSNREHIRLRQGCAHRRCFSLNPYQGTLYAS